MLVKAPSAERSNLDGKGEGGQLLFHARSAGELCLVKRTDKFKIFPGKLIPSFTSSEQRWCRGNQFKSVSSLKSGFMSQVRKAFMYVAGIGSPALPHGS